jgi:hypothetical protein
MQIPATLGMIRNDRRYGKLDWPLDLLTVADLAMSWQLANAKENTFMTILRAGDHVGEKLSLTFNYHLINMQSLFHRKPPETLFEGDFEFRLNKDYHGVYTDTEVIPPGELREAVEELIIYLTPQAEEIVAEAKRLRDKD